MDRPATNGGLPATLRSERWFAGDDINGFNHRAWLKPVGFSDEALRGRPVIGICNTWSELVGCNVHLRGLAEAVKRGVLQAGGLPLEFPVLSLSETLMKPNAMLYRNLASMDVESMIRSHPLDAVVLLSSCDKTTPAVLMGAASANVPAILVTGGPQLAGHFRGRPAGSGTDFWHYSYEVRHGRMSVEEYRELEGALCRSHGHCMEMATAMSMAAMGEALGLTLPDGASIPAVDARRAVLAERSGRRAVELAREGLRPSDVLTKPAFENAVKVLMAIGGSTNAVVHLLAIAGRLGVDLTLDDFAAAAHVPVLANLKPSGAHLLDAFFHAGGVPSLMCELRELLDLGLPTVTGRTVGENVAGAATLDGDVIRPLDDPLLPYSAIAVLRGSLAPGGALVKRSAASPALFRHRGPALAFETVAELNDQLDDPGLAVTPETVVVLKHGGPVGGPGMPEWGHIPIPGRLQDAVEDLVRISDSRISGGSHGLMVVHVTPEAAVGGPIGAVETGDIVSLDVEAGRVELEVEQREVERRLADRPPREPAYRRGYEALYLEHVLQADRGCDLDVLVHRADDPPSEVPLGLMSGWVLGD
jgi:dihydroxy-acid dehydratase